MNLVKLLKKKDKNYKMKRIFMLLSNKDEAEDKDLSHKINQKTQSIVSNNITKYNSNGNLM